ncbi:MAG: MFS transporter [Anaerolineae bacterium]|nr:MFS transporter [Anaerolineae bacterium]
MRTFYTLILTQTFSLIGSRISGLAIGIWIYGDTGNATPLALVAFFSTVPTMLAGFISGVLADRWDRRYVMMLADAGQAVGTVLLLLSVVSGQFELWHLYTVALIQSIFGVFQGPAFGAAVTMLVPDSQRDRANAINQMSGPAAGVIAPIIAGVIYALVGLVGSILIDLMTFLVAVAVLFVIRIPQPEQTAEGLATRGSVWKEALGGLSYLNKRRTLLFMLFYISLVNFLVGGVMVLGTPYILSRTNNNEALLGLLLGLINVGMLTGAIIMGTWGGTRPRIHTIMIGIIVLGLTVALAGIMQTPVLLGAAMAIMLMPAPFINTSIMSMMQVKIPSDLQGRVFALMGQMSLLLLPLSYLIMGPLADQVFEPAVGQAGWQVVAPLVGDSAGAGIGLMYVVAGLFTALISALVYSLPAIRQMEAHLPDYAPTPVPPDIPSEVAAI